MPVYPIPKNPLTDKPMDVNPMDVMGLAAPLGVPGSIYKTVAGPESDMMAKQFGGKPLEEMVTAIAEHKLRNAMTVRDYKTVADMSKKLFSLGDAYTKAKQKAIDILMGFGKGGMR